MIELRSVSKSFGPVKAVQDVSFSTREGEIFGLLGPNGAGKSTTIKMIMNILAPDSGGIFFNGKHITESDKDRIGYLPEERGLYRKVKINEMLLYLASLKNADMAAAARRLDQWLARFDLSEWKTRTPDTLSKGMAQKVQFIAAVLHDPEFIFLDEPFTGLDPVSTDVLREAVLELGRQGKTILFSTHNMEVAEKICSRILVIDHGREVISGSLADIKTRHGHNSVVAEFDGDLDLKSLDGLAANVNRFPRWVEIELAVGASPQALLKTLVGQVAVRRFEIVAPSLHKIFVELVGKGVTTDSEGMAEWMGKLLKIIRMESRLTAANKAFVILTILGPFLIAAITILPTLLTMPGSAINTTETKIALLGADPAFVASVAPVFEASKIKVSAVQESTDALDAAVRAGTWDGYLIVPSDLGTASRLQYVSKNAADFRIVGVLQGVIGQSIITARLMKAGIPAADIAALTQPPTFDSRQLTASGEKKSSDFFTVLMSGLLLAMIIYMTTLLYGQAIGRSVLLEKTSKTVEIMLSSVRPMHLMFGKILGKALASLLQYAVWVLMSTLVLRLLQPVLGVSINLAVNASTLGYLVLYFILAFFLYCSLYAALGAAAEDEQHLTQLAWPVLIFLIIPVVMISPIITSPNTPFIVGMSLFPLTAPIVMFLRIVVGAVPAWQILLSVGLLLVTIALVIWLSAKIFRVGLLMTGKRFKFTEVIRLARYS